MGQDFSSDSPLLPLFQAAWDLSVNNGTFSCFNQMQFWERFLWFSKSIKNDICSALTLVKSSTEHKHWKLLVGEEVIKIPQPLYACLINPVTLWGCQLGAESLDMSLGFSSVHWLGAAAETKYVFIMVCLSYALHNYVLRLKKGLSSTGWGTWPFWAEGLINAMNLIQGFV